MNLSATLDRLTLAIFVAIALTPTARLHAAEPIKHPSGFVFPQTVASFHRDRVIRNDKEGKNISVVYSDPKAPATITVSVYPAPAPYSPSSLRKHHNDCVRQIAAHDRSMQRVLEHETVPRGSYRGFGGMYAYHDVFGGRMQFVISLLNIYQSGDYIVKFQETYPDASAETAPGPIGKFREAFSWPK